jgi:catechol 2,3-dioxygenase-like lactoylglutathione lyase family enzyme
MADEPAPKLTVSEVVLNVTDIESMSRFYQDVLGFPEFARFPEEEPTIIFLTIAPLDTPLGKTHPQLLALIDPARHTPVHGRFESPAARTSTLNHLAFEIHPHNYDAEFERLESGGLSPKATRFEWLSAKAIFFSDPEGNTLELICPER